jgi:hypothetical protein
MSRLGSAQEDGGIVRAPIGRGQWGVGEWVAGGELEEVLAGVGAVRETMVDDGLAFVRRRVDDVWYMYFVKNLSEKVFTARQSFVKKGHLFEGWYRFDGDWMSYGEPIRILPGETVRIVTGDPRMYARSKFIEEIQVPAEIPAEVPGPWTLSFIEGGPTLPPDMSLDKARPWTDLGNAEMEAFSGTASYSAVLNATDREVRIEVEDVGDSARLLVDGIDQGVRLAPPYAWDVRLSYLTSVPIAIEVTNVAANRIRWMDQQGLEWRIFKDINFVNIDYKPFDASAWPVRPAGILGPVTITPLEPWKPEAE